MQAMLVFAIIFALIVMSFMFVFGFQMIGDWFAVQDQAALKKETAAVQAAAGKAYGYAEGSITEHQLRLPQDATVCFIDPARPDSRKWQPEWKSWEVSRQEANRMLDPSSSYYGKNLIVRYQGQTEARLEIAYLRPQATLSDPGNFCAIGGRTLRFANLGDHVQVSVS